MQESLGNPKLSLCGRQTQLVRVDARKHESTPLHTEEAKALEAPVDRAIYRRAAIIAYMMDDTDHFLLTIS